jgi:hypothetical protein
MMKLLRDLFTEDDAGTTWCLVRIASGLMASMFTVAALAAIVHGTVNFQEFGLGGAGLIGGIGTGIGVKSRLGADIVTTKPPKPGAPGAPVKPPVHADDGD